MKNSFLPLLLISLYSVNASPSAGSNQNQQKILEWNIVTNSNFSAQIRDHPLVLLVVTVPWSGESKSLMKEVSDSASYKPEKLQNLRFMVLYKNKEKTLADSLEVTEETTIFIYHNAVSYKYRGRLRALNILSSVDYVISSPIKQLPFKLLNTAVDMNEFLNSADKTVLLFEFCGWTTQLLDQMKSNRSGYGLRVGGASHNGISIGATLYGDLNFTAHRGESQKGLNIEKLTCDTHSEVGGIPWAGGFTTRNQSASAETESAVLSVGSSCTFEEFQQFESFFSKFMIFTREHFLPPERQRFGLISERYLLSSLGVTDPDPWLVMVHFAGCSNCSKILRKGDDPKNALSVHQLPVIELKSEGHNVESALLRNRPSVILFVDRSSESINTKTESKTALQNFRKLALHNHHNLPDNMVSRKSSDHAFQGMDVRSRSYPSSRRDSLQKVRADNFKNKMSVTIINEDGKIDLDADADAHVMSLQEILTHLLKQKKEAKLSVVAKEVGFQLLSEDAEIKLADFLQPQTESGKSELSEIATGNNVESRLSPGEDIHASSTLLDPEGQKEVADYEPSRSKENKITFTVKDTQMASSVPDQTAANTGLAASQDRLEGRSSAEVDKLEVHQYRHEDLTGFFFSDGGYHLLNSLTSSTEVPSMIIVDPNSEQHYIYPKEEAFSISSLQGFFDAFLNGSLVAYQRSESSLSNSREATRPPFVNFDFHEVDSVPRVTVKTFSEFVLGFNQSESKNTGYSWEKDVLVLFSNNWCGFCQRMELVVREVFRACKGFLKEYTNRKSALNNDITENAKLAEFPLIFLMDCTLNDCAALLKSLSQREVYPALLLFPAKRKSPLPYKGDVSVNNVLKFLIDNGSKSHHLGEGVLWSVGQDENEDEVSVEDTSPSLIRIEKDSAAEEMHHEVRSTKTPAGTIHTSNDLHEATPNVVVGSVLISTDMLLNAPPFDKSVILIVQANQSTGFQGLIINKHISWESFKELTKGLEFLKHAPLSFGGPLVMNGMPLVSLTKRVIHKDCSEVLPSVCFLGQAETVGEIEGFKSGKQSTDDFWFFLGFSNWGWEQLFAEIAEGAWQLSDDPTAEVQWPGS